MTNWQLDLPGRLGADHFMKASRRAIALWRQQSALGRQWEENCLCRPDRFDWARLKRWLAGRPAANWLQ